MLFAPNGNSRAFSITSAPYENRIEFITHLTSSPFKQSLSALKPGDAVQITEPTGDFLWPDTTENPLLIAGGVGISPFRSIWRDRLHRNLSLQADLFYYAAPELFLFTEELAQLTSVHPEFAVHRISNPLTEQGSIKEVETWSDRLVLMSGIYSQGKPQDFTQDNYADALKREEAAFADAARGLAG